MEIEAQLGALRAAALQAVVDGLRATFDVGRCTLRLEATGDGFGVAHEARVDGARSLIGDREVSLRGQPVVEALLSGEPQVVQDDSRTASDDPAFQRMLVSYGGLAAQIVTAVRVEGALRGIISLHELRRPRAWTPDERDLAARAAGLVGAILAGAPAPG